MAATETDHQLDDPEFLAAQLERLATRLRRDAPVGEGGRAELAALLPCEPVVGPVAVVAWRSRDGEGEAWELVRLHGAGGAEGAEEGAEGGDQGELGERLDDPVALRESLALHGMLEAVEELARPGVVEPLERALHGWRETLAAARERAGEGEGEAAGTGAAAVAAGDAEGRGAALDEALETAHARVTAVVELSVDAGTVRLASTTRLDALASSLHALERAWTELEQAAEQWSERTYAAAGGDIAGREIVQELWETLTLARRGVLRAPVTGAVQSGREAGVAMAKSVVAPEVTDGDAAR